MKSLAADTKDSAETVVTAVRTECEQQDTEAWASVMKSTKDATFSEGFVIGLAMGILERRLTDQATEYIVKLRAGMNPRFESPMGLPLELAVKQPASSCDANSFARLALNRLLAINRFFEKQGVNMRLEDMRALGVAPPPDSSYCLPKRTPMPEFA
jgi:hypothetical protein